MLIRKTCVYEIMVYVPIIETTNTQQDITKMELNKGSRGFRLLTPGNPKTEKGRAQGYWTFILHFAPADLSGFNVCALSTAGCRKACLNTAGRGGIKAGTGILTYAMVKRGNRNRDTARTAHCGLGHSFSFAPSSCKSWPKRLPRRS